MLIWVKKVRKTYLHVVNNSAKLLSLMRVKWQFTLLFGYPYCLLVTIYLPISVIASIAVMALTNLFIYNK